jgi:hypothetical protein
MQFRHNLNSKHTPEEQDAKKRGTKRVFGPTTYIKGVHTQCDHVINGKRCNKHHLRRDCDAFKEMQRLARETVATATEEDEEDTVGCIFDVTAGECSPSVYQDGTGAYSFDLPVVEPAVKVAAAGEFGFNEYVEAPIAGGADPPCVFRLPRFSAPAHGTCEGQIVCGGSAGHRRFSAAP